MSNVTNKSRRDFLRNLQYVLAGGAATAMLPQLELVGRAMALSPAALTGYRATVCIFLLGGNDSFNMLVPYAQGEYDAYLTARGGVFNASNNGQGLGIARDALLPIADAGSGKQYGLHPSMTQVKTLFDSGELAFMANVGTLVEPITKTEFTARSKPMPPSLYSHNDQQRLWMMGHSANLNGTRGWGGLCADKLRVANNAGLAGLPPSITIAGNNLFQNGTLTTPYAMSGSGPALHRYASNMNSTGDYIRREALEELVNRKYTASLMQDQYAVLGDSAMVLGETLTSVLDPAKGGDISTVFPANNHLASQLRMVARTIKASRTSAINHSRQIYYVTMGGFDTHDNQINNQAGLLTRVSEALMAFRNALNEIGALNDVTTFTMSDFGRTLNSNGNGTDHGWGGVQMMMGGSASKGGPLNGKRVYGTYPVLELDGAQSVGRGRMIPTTSNNQFSATFAKWLGMDSADLGTVFAGLDKFSAPTLDFLR